MMDLPRRIISDDGYEYYCKTCENYFPQEQFNKCIKCLYGLNPNCRTCFNILRNRNIEPTLSDREIVDYMLTTLGYELNGEKSVNQQFLERHNLKQ